LDSQRPTLQVQDTAAECDRIVTFAEAVMTLIPVSPYRVSYM